MRTVVVTGDLVRDHYILRYPTSPSSYHEPFSRTVSRRPKGGAWYLSKIIGLACSGEAELQQPQELPGPEPAPESTQRVNQAYTIWSMSDQKIGSQEKVWRIDQFLGCDREESGPSRNLEWAQPVRQDLPKPDVLVLDDLGLGFNNNEELWPEPLFASAKDIILKTSRSPSESLLFNHLVKPDQTCGGKLTVVLSVNLLRARGATISQGLSWDRSIEETIREFEQGRSAQDLALCKRVVVRFGTAGAASFTRPVKSDRVIFERFLYHPEEQEGDWERQHPGLTFGATPIMTAALVRHTLDPAAYPLYIALGRALRAAQILHKKGAWKISNFDPEVAHDDIKKVLRRAADDEDPAFKFFTAFPHDIMSERVRSKLSNKSNLLRDLTGVGLKYVAAKATDVVLRGPEKALEAIPKAHYGEFVTVDREEIERINAIRKLAEIYLLSPTDQRPLSIAVFGPPGSGKSTAIKQLAQVLFGEKRDSLVFNLSEFGRKGLPLLQEAFHRVRDAAVKGKVPLVFWDEFDADRLFWLKYFLAPMQDSEFRSGSLVHPIGKALFVFAGGTKFTFEEFIGPLSNERGEESNKRGEESNKREEESRIFREKKGPDFVSRLRGFINIKGPNPTADDSERDPAYLIRRAMLLRRLLERDFPHLINDAQDGMALVSPSVIRGFLWVKKYLHGARSLDSLLHASRLKSSDHFFEPAQLPPDDLLRLYVTPDFLREVWEGDLEIPVIEAIAKATHEEWFEQEKKEHSNWPGLGNPRYKDYDDLAEEFKEDNRLRARYVGAILDECQYDIKRRYLDGGDKAKNIDEKTTHEIIKIWHDIWIRSKLLKGYEKGDSKDEKLRRHPAIERYEAVHDVKNLDRFRQLVGVIPNVLDANGYILVKRHNS